MRRPTNAEKPFEPGEVIEWGGQRLVVASNSGPKGEVWQRGRRVELIWDFGGEVARRVEKQEGE